MPARTKIQEIMTKGVFSVQIDDTLRKADEIIKTENVRHVPVLEGEKYIGMITERSIMEYTLRQLYDYHDHSFGEDGYSRISDFQDIITKPKYLVYPEDSIQKAVELMGKRKLDCLPVVDWQGNLVGILTSVDLMIFFYRWLSEH